MRFLLVVLSTMLSVQLYAKSSEVYERFFLDYTLRVDYFHSGTKGEEVFSLDKAYEEGEWPGSRTNLLDTLNLGEFIVRVYDQATTSLIYSRGFSSIFNEWQTTDEAAKGVRRTFSESIRLPYPRRAIQFTIARRDKRMIFHELFSAIIDPNVASEVNKVEQSLLYQVEPVMENGKPSEKVDIVILADGYAKSEMEKFRKDAKHLNDVMFQTMPFKARAKDFNVWMVECESPKSGIDMPDKNVWKGNVLGSQYSTFGLSRYVLTTNNKAVRDIAALAPYDFICILVNDTRYGGGGIYNLYATTYTRESVAGQEWRMDYVYVHEFGHSFAGLGDEYYNSTTAYNDFYEQGIEPWEPNVTALTDKKNVKWKGLLSPGAEVPTLWEKVQYDSIMTVWSKLDRTSPTFYQQDAPLLKAGKSLLRNSRFAGKVGVFEGSGYASKGLFRPAIDCRMFSLDLVDFDPVCSAAINRMADFYSK